MYNKAQQHTCMHNDKQNIARLASVDATRFNVMVNIIYCNGKYATFVLSMQTMIIQISATFSLNSVDTITLK